MDAPVTAVVVAFDSAHALPDCLAAIARAGIPAIVVDNASADDSVAVAERHGAVVMRNELNQGYGRGNNIGIRAATSEFALIVNPDLVLADGAVAELVAAARRYPEAGIVAPRVEEPSGRVFFQPQSLLARVLTNPSARLSIPEGDACAPFVSGACMLVRREAFLALGGFDENIFLFYEDDDLCRRMMDAGFSVVYAPAAKALHGRGKSSAPRPWRTLMTRWHQAWSRAYVSRKYGLKDPALRMLLANAPKAFGAMLLFRLPTIERYGGTALGALDWLRGRTALATMGLEKPPKEERE